MRNFVATLQPTRKDNKMVLLQKAQELNFQALANWIDKVKRVSINQKSSRTKWTNKLMPGRKEKTKLQNNTEQIWFSINVWKSTDVFSLSQGEPTSSVRRAGEELGCARRLIFFFLNSLFYYLIRQSFQRLWRICLFRSTSAQYSNHPRWFWERNDDDSEQTDVFEV